MDSSWIPEELTSILREVEKAIEVKLYYVAIAVALSIPDICACLEFDPDNPSWANGDTYSGWWDRNGLGRFRNLTGKDLYYLRGGVLHKGHFDHSKSRYDRVMFIGPESSIKAHDVVITIEPGVTFGGVSARELRLEGQILQMDVLLFCQAIMDTARQWYLSKRADPFVVRNLPQLVRYRPDGLTPFSRGVPTVA